MTTTSTRPSLPVLNHDAPAAPSKRGRVLTWLTASAATITGGLGVLIACAACCLPLLVGAGFLTGAAAAGLHNVFLGSGAALMLAAGGLLLLRRRRTRRAGQSGCGDNCGC
ncbi:hypothetical protein [Cryptosporangium minutisporangium]|uniref:Mercuric ion transport protein n=1 Tax=Cryptosporangium minutisporangium TaxID=113569 RepID=A0ABP6SQR8_9ACTN